MVSVLAYVLKKFYILCAILVIGLAVVVQSGRSLFPLLANYEQQFATYLSEQLDMTVRIGRLDAEWEELKPSVTLYQLQVEDDQGRRLLDARKVLLRLNLLSTVLEQRLAWDKVELHRPQLSLSQGSDGYWGLPDFSANAEEDEQPLAPDDLLTLFELGARVELLEARIDLSFANDHQQQLVAPYLLLEHQDDFHRLSLQIDLNGRDRALYAVLEGHGDPRDPANFKTEGYLQLRGFPTLEPLTAIGGILFGESEHRDWYREAQMNASLWFSSQDDGGGYDWVGNLGLDEVALPLEEMTLNRVGAELSGEWRRSGSWRLNLQDLSAEWRDRELEPLQLSISTAGTEAPVHWMVDHLSLEYWVTLTDQLGLLGEGQLREVVQTLSPGGDLRNVQFTLPQSDWRDWELMAELDGVKVQPWQGVPGLEGVDGFVEASRKGGHVDLDSRNGFSMFYAQTYSEPLSYESARGQVAWHLRPDENQIYVNSGPLQLSGPGERATGSLWLSLPWERKTGDIDLYLDIYGEQLNANVYPKYLPKVVPEPLTEWLQRSLGEDNPGRASGAHFVFRGTLNRPGQPRMNSYQLALDMTGADLAYHPDWPTVTDLSGQLLLDNNRVEAHIDQAYLRSSELNDARIRVDDNPEGEGLLLRIDGDLNALASDGLEVLREGYLRRYIADNLDSWRIQGAVDTEISLAIPLEDNQPGARQRIVMDLNVPRLTLGDLNLTLRDIRGDLRYDHDRGLSSEGMTGSLFDEPLDVTISGRRESGQAITQIDFMGRTSGESLAAWAGRPELQFLDGTFGFRSRLELNHYEEPDPERDQRLAMFTLNTDLDGVSISVPEPLGKLAEQSRELNLSVILGRQTALAEVGYGERVEALVQFDREAQQVRRASLGIDAQAQLPDAPGIFLSGQLEQLNLAGWRDVFRRYQGLLDDGDREPGEVLSAAEQLPVQASVRLVNHQLGPMALENLDLEIASTDSGWQLAFDNSQLQGQVGWSPEQPLTVQLDRVDLPKAALEPAGTAASSGPVFDPRTLPAANVTLANLLLDGEDFGRWEFQARPDESGLILRDIQGEIRGLTISGREDEEGAFLRWHHDDQGASTTELDARVQAGDLATVMQQWGQSDILESQSANYAVNLRWAGAPQQFELEQLEGDVGFSVLSGRFKRNPASGSDGLLRLFAVLNFDSLARRLRLDFSDLYQSGLAYDSIEGQMTFERGQLVFSEPVMVRSPSSRLQLAGQANLIDETLNTRLVATLPVAGNLTFLTALAAGLPAAAGVFLVSKLFEKQVDQATSITYQIKGDWDDPTIKFDRMFEGEASLKTDGDATEAQPE